MLVVIFFNLEKVVLGFLTLSLAMASSYPRLVISLWTAMGVMYAPVRLGQQLVLHPYF